MAKNKWILGGALAKGLFALAVIVSAAWAMQVMSSAYLRAWGDRARDVDKSGRAERLYKLSVIVDPQNWQAYLGLGKIYGQARYDEIEPAVKRGMALKEKEALLQAYRHDTKRSEITYGLGRADFVLGNREAGLDYLREAAQLSRFNDYYWRKLGIELRKAAFYEEARSVFEYADQLDPSNKTVKRNIQWLEEMRENDEI